MKKYMKIFIVINIIIFTSCTQEENKDSSSKTIQRVNKNVEKFKRVALVIGNEKYEVSPLTHAVDDADAMRDFLEKKGFEVVYAENATEEMMQNRIAEFLSKLDNKSIGFVYYSGHGIQEFSEKEHQVVNYLIPVNNKQLNNKANLDYHTISLNELVASLSEKKSGLNIVLLDACRTPYKAFSKSSKKGLASTNAEGVYIAYATASGKEALDDSMFRKLFIEYAKKPLKLIDIFENVKEDIYAKTKQTPFTSNGKRGSFYFTKPKNIKNIQEITSKDISDSLTKSNPISLEETCNSNNADACYFLSTKFFRSKNYKKAIKFIKKACDLNNSHACFRLAMEYNFGRRVNKDKVKSLRLVEKACDLNDKSGCRHLGVIYAVGKGVVKNRKKAIFFSTKACSLDSGGACDSLGVIYSIKKDYSKALKSYKKACDLNFGSGCGHLADVYETGKGVAKDKSKAIQLYTKACTMNDSYGCRNLGDIYRVGKSVKKDINKAKSFYREACHLGSEKACKRLNK